MNKNIQVSNTKIKVEFIISQAEMNLFKQKV